MRKLPLDVKAVSALPEDYLPAQSVESSRNSRQSHAGKTALRDAAGQLFLGPSTVRFGRTPDKIRQVQSERIEAEAAAARKVAEDAARPANAPNSLNRVRRERTPNHLLQQVWGVASRVEIPVVSDEPDVATHEETSWLGEEMDTAPIVTVAADNPAMPTSDRPEIPSTPLAFISDSAFWEFGPEAIDGHVRAPFEGKIPDRVDTRPMAEEFEDSSTADCDVPASTANEPSAAPVTESISATVSSNFGWASTYNVNFQPFSNSWFNATPAAEAAFGNAQPGAETSLPAQVDVEPATPQPKPARRSPRVQEASEFELPPISFLAEPTQPTDTSVPVEALQQNAGLLESVLEDFNVRGEIVQACAGPVVTLYELEPAPGTKSSRVISLSDDIARSMSAVSARVAVVQGKNAIGH